LKLNLNGGFLALRTRAVAFLSGIFLTVCSPAFSQCAKRAVLNDHERNGFVSAAYGRREQVPAEFLAAEGCEQVMLNSLLNLRASVRFADMKVGYALAILPRENVLSALDLPGIAYAFAITEDSDGGHSFLPPSERTTAPEPNFTIPFPQVAASLPTDGPFFAAAEAGLTELWRQHPEADGRGVRVAVEDQGLDLLHPALQLAKDAKGNPIPKVADVVPFTSPEEDDNWVQFGDPIETTNGTFVAVGRTWTVPQEGTYRFGIFTKQIHLGFLDPMDVNPRVQSVSWSVGVLWDEQSNRVWIDTDGDGSFRNQRALRDYAEAQDLEYFGYKKGPDDNRIPFGIKIDRSRRSVYLGLPDGDHGAIVAGPLAANRVTGGLFDGAAPGAQLIDVREKPSYGYMAWILSGFARSDVDVINRSGAVSYATDDGQFDFRRRVLERAIAFYDKPIACVCAASNSLNVYDYQSPEMLRRNRQLPPPYAEAMTSGVWFAPDGLVNTVVAPSASLITQSRYMPYAVLWEDGRTHMTSTLLEPSAPAGYAIGANPSPTIPVVSGILADLVSEARRTHVRYSAARLTQAVLTGTRLVPSFAASVQGFGLIDAAGAWDQLAKMAKADDPRNSLLTSFTAARVEDGERKEVNGFQMDLPKAGGVVRGELWITRHGGYRGGRAYAFALRANDGTYELFNRKATLVRDRPARVSFTAKITSGLHVAFLQLVDARRRVVMEELPLSVRAPDVPAMIAPGVEKYTATIPPLRLDARLVRIGDDVQAAGFTMRIPYPGAGSSSLRVMPGFFYGVGAGHRFMATGRASGESVDAAHHVGPEEEFESLVINPKATTHEVYWGNYDRPEYATPYDDPAPDVPITATLTVSRYAVDLKRVDERNVQVTNKLADINGKVEFYDAKLTSSELTGTDNHAEAAVERTLPENLSQWRVAVSSTSSDDTAVDAYLLDCTSKAGCSVAAQKPITATGATLMVDDPKGGEWQIVIRTREMVQRPISYTVKDAKLIPNSSATQAADARHASGAIWSIPLPSTSSDAEYVAFRIASIPDKNEQKSGLRIAMTALTTQAP
jgi:hypothetical protein